MGNNVSTSSSDQAIEHFLRRELDEVLRVRRGEHHGVLFIPDMFLFKGLVEKVANAQIIISINSPKITFYQQTQDMQCLHGCDAIEIKSSVGWKFWLV